MPEPAQYRIPTVPRSPHTGNERALLRKAAAVIAASKGIEELEQRILELIAESTHAERTAFLSRQGYQDKTTPLAGRGRRALPQPLAVTRSLVPPKPCGASPEGIIRFGVFEVDLASGELHKKGRKVRIQEQPFQILLALLERSGEVVARDELRQRLWSDDTYVDFDSGLNSAISRVREALGDSASNPRFIETLPRRGYRFMAEVRRIEPVVHTPEQHDVTGPPIPRRIRWYVAAALLVAVIIAGVWLGCNAPKASAAPVPDAPISSSNSARVSPVSSWTSPRVTSDWKRGTEIDGCYQCSVGLPTPVESDPQHPFSSPLR